MGYVGAGLLDGAAIGNVFASPSADQMLEVTAADRGGAGVLYLYGNYGGDVLNFDLAAELAGAYGIEVRTRARRRRRRLGAAGARGPAARHRRDLLPVQDRRRRGGRRRRRSTRSSRSPTRAADGLRSMGVALSPCTLPAAGVPTFELPDGEMEIGMGIHGEPGVRRGPLEPADRIADELVRAILADLPFEPGRRVAVLVNGLGATPKEELYILYRRRRRAPRASGG